ncbi:MAG: phosphatidylserine decarboxylase [Planctomycetes bacterium]|nr:phosphatidylserine decarboxylase [Planctomycetota bacterium]
MADPVRYIDRLTGRIETERIFGEGALRFVYGAGRGHRLARRLLRTRGLSHLYGAWQRSTWSRQRVRPFADALGIDVAEAELPLEGYPTLDAFFTRRLRPGARPVDPGPEALVSPCDARTLVFPALHRGLVPLKGGSFPLEEVLRDRGLAARYRGGDVVVLRLAPADYHRFHFPDDGVPGPPRWIGGALDSVHPVALRSGASSFCANRRAVTRLESRGFGDLLLVEVGALCVGTIVQTYRPGWPVARGEEKGLFRFGGSTVLLCVEPGRVHWEADLLAGTALDLETLVRMGTRLGTRAQGD